MGSFNYEETTAATSQKSLSLEDIEEAIKYAKESDFYVATLEVATNCLKDFKYKFAVDKPEPVTKDLLLWRYRSAKPPPTPFMLRIPIECLHCGKEIEEPIFCSRECQVDFYSQVALAEATCKLASPFIITGRL